MINEKKNIGLLYIGKTVSSFGSKTFSFALSYYLLTITNSSLQFSLSLAINYLPPIIFSPIAGIMSDHFNKKRVIIVSDLFSSLMILIPIIGRLSIGSIYSTIFILSTISVLFNNCVDASIPFLVQRKDAQTLKKYLPVCN